MNYIYKVNENNDEIEEISENQVSLIWSISDLKKESPGIVSMWFNRKQTKENRIQSFKRTKEHVFNNIPEILL
jgi:hypothetical protein